MKPTDWGVFRWAGALWVVLALALCVAAFFGLGGWSRALDVHPNEGSIAPATEMAQSMPEAPIETAMIAQHSLFSRKRGPDMQSFSPQAASDMAAVSQEWALTSMMITPALTVATLQSSSGQTVRVRLGEGLPGGVWSFSRAEPRAAILLGPSGERRLILRTFTGQGDGSATAYGMNPVSPPISAVTSAPADAAVVTPSENAPALSPEEAMRQRLAKRRAELQSQDSQGQIPR